MGDLIDLNVWIEQKVNELAQRHVKLRNTTCSKELECELKEWGHKMAKYKMHQMRTEQAQEREQANGTTFTEN